MTYPLSSNVWNVLICSYCGHALEKINSGVECPDCNLKYQYTNSGALDLRLKRSKKYYLELDLETSLLPDNGFQFEPLAINTEQEVDFSNMSVPQHLTKEMLSYFPKAKSSDSLMLDLGCGGAIHKGVCGYAGFEWVGLDYDSPEALILGDAHSLPFKSDTFEFILSVAVLEHIRFPFVMMSEAYRVLEPHG